MQAVVVRDYGPPEQYAVAELPVPRPGPGQLLVRVAAASINPGDVVIPSGRFRDAAPLTFPHVPGNDFAGTVAEVGPAVRGYVPGDEIFGYAAPRALRPMLGPRPSMSTGSLAQYTVVEADTPFVTHRPAGLTAEQAAALATTGLAARAVLATAGIRPGERVLVVGATGGVGTTLLPLLAAARATVVATATEHDADLVRDLGATEVVGYDERGYPEGVDAAFNLTLPSDRLTGVARAVRPGGRLLTITYPVPRQDWIGRDDVDLRFVLDMEGALGGMREVADLATNGPLRATIGRRYTLGEGAQACVDFERRHTTGKLVVVM
ncbi:NADP-dependent oxidoreductase [Dactylosporangium aurantiacum]|uniref:NADP-dependent oxidoreductase n=1 Tax=Dactylosporangium aurantiacum TaxID=35754 RepID=A0A9Q9IN11_9ACTN|nr:NADP-dependent oxidoreductase [Dactylosporangium aurantiacum]MDG6108606.1 NADP-dependent oxidoreductase [Dactylosporangium aurantiacum]UWZ59174.1 NADP-dependent oxidoreductase [Dactylosporangium aurantiacum]